VAVFHRRVALDELVPLVLTRLAVPTTAIKVAIPEDLPEASTDPGLLERVLANLVTNALRFSPPDRPPVITGSLLDVPDQPPRLELRIIDHGPGIPETERDRAFVPFQRLGDRDNTVGVGLGLAVARGLTEALGGALEPEETPGGGLTMVVNLPAADASALGAAEPDGRAEPEGEPQAAAQPASSAGTAPPGSGG
jgi:two-component system sensor histidine kinase KdpD